MNHPITFLDLDNITKLVPASFSYFLKFYKRKINFSLKSAIVVPVTVSLLYKETNSTVLFTFVLQKSS